MSTTWREAMECNPTRTSIRMVPPLNRGHPDSKRLELAADLSPSLWLWPAPSQMPCPLPPSKCFSLWLSCLNTLHSSTYADLDSLSGPRKQKSHTFCEAFLDNSSYHQSLAMPLAPYWTRFFFSFFLKWSHFSFSTGSQVPFVKSPCTSFTIHNTFHRTRQVIESSENICWYIHCPSFFLINPCALIRGGSMWKCSV